MVIIHHFLPFTSKNVLILKSRLGRMHSQPHGGSGKTTVVTVAPAEVCACGELYFREAVLVEEPPTC